MTIKHFLYNNTVELEFDEEKHLYHIGQTKVDGVTGVLTVINKPALIFWAVNKAVSFLEKTFVAGKVYDEMQVKEMLDTAKTAHRKSSSEASNLGKFVHQWIEDYIAGKNPAIPVNPQMKFAIDSFLKWEKDHNVKFLKSEQIVYSKEFKYAGTLDFTCEYDGKKYLGDFKTSTAIYDEYWLQTAAYQHAYLEEFPNEKIDGTIIVRIGKDGTVDFEASTPEDYKKDFNAFLGALMLRRRLEERKFNKTQNGQ